MDRETDISNRPIYWALERSSATAVRLKKPNKFLITITYYRDAHRGGGRGTIYGETNAGRMLAAALRVRGNRIRVITAYDLDADQKSAGSIHLRVPATDLEKARLIAQQKGIGYQTWLKMAIHEAVERETR